MKKIQILLIGLIISASYSLNAQCYDCPDLPLPTKYPRIWEDPDGLVFQLEEVDVME